MPATAAMAARIARPRSDGAARARPRTAASGRNSAAHHPPGASPRASRSNSHGSVVPICDRSAAPSPVAMVGTNENRRIAAPAIAARLSRSPRPRPFRVTSSIRSRRATASRSPGIERDTHRDGHGETGNETPPPVGRIRARERRLEPLHDRREHDHHTEERDPSLRIRPQDERRGHIRRCGGHGGAGTPREADRRPVAQDRSQDQGAGEDHLLRERRAADRQPGGAGERAEDGTRGEGSPQPGGPERRDELARESRRRGGEGREHATHEGGRSDQSSDDQHPGDGSEERPHQDRMSR